MKTKETKAAKSVVTTEEVKPKVVDIVDTTPKKKGGLVGGKLLIEKDEDSDGKKAKVAKAPANPAAKADTKAKAEKAEEPVKADKPVKKADKKKPQPPFKRSETDAKGRKLYSAGSNAGKIQAAVIAGGKAGLTYAEIREKAGLKTEWVGAVASTCKHIIARGLAEKKDNKICYIP
jgi:hypothetical protein